MIEEAPSYKVNSKTADIISNSVYYSLINKINNDYLYFDKVKYHVPEGISKEDFWSAIKLSRLGNTITFGPFSFHYKLTDKMSELLYKFDKSLFNDFKILKEQSYYQQSSIIEEAIASSKMEGATTTRVIAKQMILKNAKPKDISERMIMNNYKTIDFIKNHKDDDLTTTLILNIHRSITDSTLNNSLFEGHFRDSNDIFVVNGITGDVAHEPPSYKLICSLIESVCEFANNQKSFIHPILKAIIIHFMISYIHPFVDGNGRTARALFYWYLIKNDYSIIEFLSISKIIYRSKNQYEKSFIYSELDDLDIGYFITYNLKALDKSYEELIGYIEKKQKAETFIIRNQNINDRQNQILNLYIDNPNIIFTSKDLEKYLDKTVKTIRSDLNHLVSLGLLDIVKINKRLRGYSRSKMFELKLEEIRGN